MTDRDKGILKNAAVQCNACNHRKDFTNTCDAFPDRIPDDIALGDFDHTKPYPGDNGIMFEPIPE